MAAPAVDMRSSRRTGNSSRLGFRFRSVRGPVIRIAQHVETIRSTSGNQRVHVKIGIRAPPASSI